MGNAASVGDVEQVRLTVERISASRGFETTGRIKALFHYLVEEELSGRGNRLKAYSIGLDVLGKPETFDPIKDSSVRVAISHLRQRLDRYNETATADPVTIAIPPGSYRPKFQFNQVDIKSASTTASRGDDPYIAGWRHIARLAVIVVLLGGLSLWFYDRWQKNHCSDQRPTLNVSGLTNVPENELFAKLQEYLSYYPVMDRILIKDAWPRCSGIPRFTLMISSIYEHDGRSSDITSYSVRLMDESGGSLKWSKTYYPTPNPYYRPDDLIAAQIAYDIGTGTGVIANLAAKEKWSNEEAKLRFQCLVSMHSFFAGMEDDLQSVSDCSSKFWLSSSHADFKALYAALEYEKAHFDPILDRRKEAYLSLVNHALDEARTLSANDKEYLIMRMRMARNEMPIDVATIEYLTSQMDKYLSHEPHIAEQIGVTNAAYLGNFDRGYTYSDKAEYLSNRHGITGWGKVIYYVANGQWDKLMPLKEYVAADEFPQDQVMALCIARKSGDKLMEARALKILSQHNMHNVPEYIDHIRKRVAPQKIADSLENCLTH